jgi:hypothetical protein
MSTQAYYKDRLGFDPAEALNDGSAFDRTQQGYEENLCKFKGLWEFYIESIGMGQQNSKPAVCHGVTACHLQHLSMELVLIPCSTNCNV